MLCTACNTPIKKLVGACDNKDCIKNPIHQEARCQADQCKSSNLIVMKSADRKYTYLCNVCGNVCHAHHTGHGIVYKK